MTLSQELNETLRKRTDDYPELLDFYNSYDELDVTERDEGLQTTAATSDGRRKGALNLIVISMF